MGKTWVYDYNYTLAFFDLSLTTIHGVQTWEVTSVNAGPLSTTYALGAFARDTVHISERRPPDGAWWDTTYVTERTLPLSADVSRDSINFHWLAMVRLQPGTPRFLEHLPRVVPAGNDTLALSGDYGLKNALYVAGLGLVKYTGYIPHSLGSEIETLVLSPIR
jgi:hypothetical protein